MSESSGTKSAGTGTYVAILAVAISAASLLLTFVKNRDQNVAEDSSFKTDIDNRVSDLEKRMDQDVAPVLGNLQSLSDHTHAGLDDNLPVGTILAWSPANGQPENLPGSWRRCNGSLVDDPESVFDGENLPDLADGFFLRGGTEAGVFERDGHSALVNHSHAIGQLKITGEVDAKVSRSTPHFHKILTTGSEGESGEGIASAIPGKGDGQTMTDVASNSVHSHTIDVNASGLSTVRSNTENEGNGGEPRPRNMSVIWIIKIK